MKTIVFARQKVDFSCGPACVQSVLALVRSGENACQEAIGQMLGAVKRIGTDHQVLGAWCREQLPVVSMGCNTYSGEGLAIANILNPFSGNGHFVVILHRDSKITRYYCPLLNRIVAIPTNELKWQNGSGDLHGWSVNFGIRGA
jgi:hypothetical protein